MPPVRCRSLATAVEVHVQDLVSRFHWGSDTTDDAEGGEDLEEEEDSDAESSNGTASLV